MIILTFAVHRKTPLGIMLTSSEEAEVLTRGLQCLMDLIPESAFYGWGIEGSEVFKTDDSKMERSALYIDYCFYFRVTCHTVCIRNFISFGTIILLLFDNICVKKNIFRSLFFIMGVFGMIFCYFNPSVGFHILGHFPPNNPIIVLIWCFLVC